MSMDAINVSGASGMGTGGWGAAWLRCWAVLGLVGGMLWVTGVEGGDAGWPQWRGPDRDGHAGGDVRIPLPFNPVLKWKRSVGGGFASPVVQDQVLAITDEDGAQEVVHVLDVGTGVELWRTNVAARFGDEWGAGPRSTPILDGGMIFLQSCSGEFQCRGVRDGVLLWRTNFSDFGVKFIGGKSLDGTATRRGNNGSPVVDGERVIVPVGAGERGATLVCFDKRTGRERWRALAEEAAYSSPIVARVGGVRQVVYAGADSISGVDAGSGRMLWRVPLVTFAKRHVATPLGLGDGVAINSHTFGLLKLGLSESGGRWSSTTNWLNRELLINLATPVRVGGYLYCLGSNRDYVCIDAGTGRVMWSLPGFGSGRKDHASTVVAGNRLLVLSEDGVLHLLEAGPDRPVELGRVQVCGNTWCSLAMRGGEVFLRDGRNLYAFSLGQPGS